MSIAQVITSHEFKEIMNDFTDPLEVIREAIQNSHDAGADKIIIDIKKNETPQGESLDILIEDNGDGIPKENFERFFNLGDSTKRDNSELIGEKGHGTKIYFNSNKLILESWVNFKKYNSVLQSPYHKLFNNEPLIYTDPTEVENRENKEKGVRITIEGYLKNTSTMPSIRFSHPSVKDYILWFTIFGSVKNQFKSVNNNEIYLRSFDSLWHEMQTKFKFTVNQDGFEKINFGHVFPEREYVKRVNLKGLAAHHSIRNWEDLFCKKLYKKELPVDGLSKPLQVIIWAEGDKLKRLYNPLIREKQTAATRDFQYKVSDRYGFWACKKFIPIQNIDHWITGKGTYTKFHAFINFDDFSLTANRSSIENTKLEYLKIVKDKINEIFNEVIKDRSFQEWDKLEELAKQERSAEEENKEFPKRLKEAKKKKKLVINKIAYFEPEYEGEVALLFNGLLHAYPEILNYEVLDYKTHKGIDFLVRQNRDIPLDNDSTVGYIELKLNFEGKFNHSFKNIREIICYDITGLRTEEVITDIEGKELKATKNNEGWCLADYKGQVGNSIKIFNIKDFLRSKELRFE